MMQRMTEPWPMKRMSAGSRSSSRMTGSRLRCGHNAVSRASIAEHLQGASAPNTQVVVALGARVAVRVRVRLGPLELLGVLLLDLVRREAVDVARVELVHLLPLDDLVPELGHGPRGRDAAAAGRGPHLFRARNVSTLQSRYRTVASGEGST